jgi:hypothetical protein
MSRNKIPKILSEKVLWFIFIVIARFVNYVSTKFLCFCPGLQLELQRMNFLTGTWAVGD